MLKRFSCLFGWLHLLLILSFSFSFPLSLLQCCYCKSAHSLASFLLSDRSPPSIHRAHRRPYHYRSRSSIIIISSSSSSTRRKGLLFGSTSPSSSPLELTTVAISVPPLSVPPLLVNDNVNNEDMSNRAGTTTMALSSSEGEAYEATMATTNTNPSRSTAVPAPLYITVGPPCAGKSTWLQRRRCGDSNNHNHTTIPVQDVTLDDQPGVYLALPAQYFLWDDATLARLFQLNSNYNNNDTQNSVSGIPETTARDLLNYKVVEKSIYERLVAPDQAELRLVCQYVAGNIPREHVEQTLYQMLHSAGAARQSQKEGDDKDPHTSWMTDAILQALHDECTVGGGSDGKGNSGASLPKTVDLFCREVLFTPMTTEMIDDIATTIQTINTNNNNNNNTANTADTSSKGPKTKTTAIQRAFAALRNAPVTQPVAWGNTNIRWPNDYKEALVMAAHQHRPVHFVVWDCTTMELTQQLLQDTHDNNSNNNDDETKQQQTCFLELMRRNLRRWCATGRYIPATVIWDMLVRYRQALQQMSSSSMPLRRQQQQSPGMDDEKNDVIADYLSRLAGFEWVAANQTVRFLAQPPSASTRGGRQYRDNRRAPAGQPSTDRRRPFHHGGGDNDADASRYSSRNVRPHTEQQLQSGRPRSNDSFRSPPPYNGSYHARREYGRDEAPTNGAPRFQQPSRAEYRRPEENDSAKWQHQPRVSTGRESNRSSPSSSATTDRTTNHQPRPGYGQSNPGLAAPGNSTGNEFHGRGDSRSYDGGHYRNEGERNYGGQHPPSSARQNYSKPNGGGGGGGGGGGRGYDARRGGDGGGGYNNRTQGSNTRK